MDLIKQFMKMGGFKTPEELEAYGEDNFFRDHPEARQMAMGGTPEAFNMTVPADKFFSYGVPVPPNYYAEGGLVGVPVYPQIQTAGQYFSPVYSDTNNAYAMGGNIEEFPQAQRYPQAGWGNTNHFMLGEGGTFPPGMPQYTGMLPVMQTGAATDGILTRTQDANSHYGVYPMMHGGQPMYAEGGDNNGIDNQQNFYSGRINNFTDTLRNNANTALMKFISPQNEEMAEPAGFGRRGGQGNALRKFQGNQGPSTVGIGVLLPDDNEARVINDALGMPVNIAGPQTQNTGQMASQQANQQAINNQVAQEDELLKKAKQMGHNTVADYQASGWQYGPNHPSNTKKQASNKPANKPAAKTTAKPNSGGVSTTVQPVASTTNADANAPAAQPANANPVATGPAVASNAGPGTGTPGTPAASKEWREVTYNGKKAFVNPDTNELYFPAGSGMDSAQQTKSEKTENTENPYQDLYDAGWATPGYWKEGRFKSRHDRKVFDEAVANGLLDPEQLKQSGMSITPNYRNALFEKNKGPKYRNIKSITYTIPGMPQVGARPTNMAQAPIISNPGAGPTTSTPGNSVTRVPTIQDPGTAPRPTIPYGTITGASPYDGTEVNLNSNVPSSGLSIQGPVTSSSNSSGNANVVPSINNNPPSSSYSWDPQFDEARMLGQISSNEANYFGTTRLNILDNDWRNQVVQGDLGMYQGDRAKTAWQSKVMGDPTKKKQWEGFSDMPAPLKDIAGDHLFNSGTDPRTFMLAAAGVDKGYTGQGDAVIGNPEYRKWIRSNADQLWNDNKNLITQQYNDDPQAFTQAVTDHRNVLYSNLRTTTDDILSDSGTPGLQYNAWSGRSNATQDYLNNAYFGKGTGYAYAAPQFFQKYGGPFALPMYVTGGPGSILDENPFGGTEIMTQYNPEQQMNWDTGYGDEMNKVAREIEKQGPFGKVYETTDYNNDTTFKTKPPKYKKPGWGPEAIMSAERVATNLFERLGKWNHENKDFNTALQTYGTSRKPTNRGSYTDSGIFRPDQYNWNKRGMYAPDMGYGFAQTGGQQVANMDGDQYYLTQEQINKVIKAGGRVPGF